MGYDYREVRCGGVSGGCRGFSRWRVVVLKYLVWIFKLRNFVFKKYDIMI